MKLLNKNTDYAIRALLHLGAGSAADYISAAEISDQQKIPYEFLRKLLRKLISSGIVESKEGGNGGFRLKTDPKKIRVTQLIEIFQGQLQLSECMFRQKLCHNRSRCVLRKNIVRIEDLVTKEFGRITIGSLLKELKEA